MENAPDKVVQRKSKKNQDPPESAHASEQRRFEAIKKERAKKNPVVETYYAMKGDKLILVKVKATGSKYLTPLGSTKPGIGASAEDKRVAAALLLKVKELQKAGELRIIY
jgi:hypothetical protein